MSRPPVFLCPVEALAAGQVVELGGDEGRHAAAVRRLRPGEPVQLTDGAGTLAEAVVVSAGRGVLRCEVAGVTLVARPQPRVVVAQALLPGDAGDTAVTAMTEVGVDVVVPWLAARSVARRSVDRVVARWRAVGREAAKQARRPWLPEVSGAADAAGVVGLLRSAAAGLVLDGDGPVRLGDVIVPADGDVVLVVGPEGGLTAEELAAFAAAGAGVAGLGPTVLRASTAGAVAAGVVLARSARWR